MNKKFLESIKKLIDGSNIVIDRPKGSHHPRFKELIYPLDYGYLEGTTSGDGDGIDVWVGSGEKEISALLVVCDLLKKDTEIKILMGCNRAEIEKVLSHHRRGDMTATLVGAA